MRVLILCCVAIATVHASLLPLDSKDMAVAYANGTRVFNISKIFNFPVSVKGPPDGGNIYYYEWDPTKPVPCPGSTHKDVAVCQRTSKTYRPGNIEFNAGSLHTRFFLAARLCT